MNIMSVDYTLQHQSLDIYVAGCKAPHCVNCYNKSAWPFDAGVPFGDDVLATVRYKVEHFKDLIKNIMVFGGEPLDQDIDELLYMLAMLKKMGLPVWVYTRYELEDVPMRVKYFADYIKTGKYDENSACNDNRQYGIVLATSNQKINKKGVDY